MDDEIIYMLQLEYFISRDSKTMVNKLKKSINGLKKIYHKWYHKFYHIILLFGFEMSTIDECVYHNFNENKHIFLILYVGWDITCRQRFGLTMWC